MICLTGDLHHMSLGTGNQKHCEITEIQVARRYLDMLSEAGVKVTFFVSGKSFVEEWEDLKPICDNPLVEIGGHGYTSFKPELWHRVCNKIIGSYNGPAWYQRWDTVRTMEAYQKRCGKKISFWRNHMYMHGPHTEQVLTSCGIKMVSDGVKRYSNGPERHSTGIFNFPINIIPDHEHLFHAERTREWVAQWIKRYNWSDDFGSDSYDVEPWTDMVLEQLHLNEERGVLSNMIIHPITLYLCDGLKSFQRILEFLSTHQTVHYEEVYDRVTARDTKKVD